MAYQGRAKGGGGHRGGGVKGKRVSRSTACCDPEREEYRQNNWDLAIAQQLGYSAFSCRAEQSHEENVRQKVCYGHTLFGRRGLLFPRNRLTPLPGKEHSRYKRCSTFCYFNWPNTRTCNHTHIDLHTYMQTHECNCYKRAQTDIQAPCTQVECYFPGWEQPVRHHH